MKRFLSVLLIIITVLSLSTVLTDAADDERIIVSLGDSYSAGEGIEKFYGQDLALSKKVKDQDWLAHRSTASWPGQLTLDGKTMKDYRNTNWFFVATSGAETKHLDSKQKKEYSKDDLSGTAYIDPQLNVFSKCSDPDYVTLTLGGNDAGFSSIITTAVMNINYFDKSNLANQLNETWADFYKEDGIRDALSDAYDKIEEKAGSNAKIIVAGYPTLVDSTGKMWFSKEEAKLINDSVLRFNDEIETLINSKKGNGMKICFVSVEDTFKGHEAYTDEPYINSVMTVQSQDLKDFSFSDVSHTVASAYSIHPNKEGAKRYAECVQKKIDAIEKDNGASEWPQRASSDERDVVLVIDTSGSMSGTPLSETVTAARRFIDTVLLADAAVGIVTYDSKAFLISDLNKSKQYLNSKLDTLRAGGNTNLDEGLQLATEMLDGSNARKKLIVVMSDGLPNCGRTGGELISYAEQIRQMGISIYTLGFFENVSDKASAQELMESIAGEGCHYEIDDAQNIRYFFGDVADVISGQKYYYVRIACPVDVTVKFNGETLTSINSEKSVRTSFGSLTFEEGGDSTENDERVKILRLKADNEYEVLIEGNGRGRMNCTFGYMDDEGAYTDMRRFVNVKITKDTVIEAEVNGKDTTTLSVDEDGDGKNDIIYKAKENSRGEKVDNSHLTLIACVCAAIVTALIITVIIKLKGDKKHE